MRKLGLLGLVFVWCFALYATWYQPFGEQGKPTQVSQSVTPVQFSTSRPGGASHLFRHVLSQAEVQGDATNSADAESPSGTNESSGQDSNTGADSESPSQTTNQSSGETQADQNTNEESAIASSLAESENEAASEYGYYPLVVLGVGIAIVLGLIIGFRINAFIALITAAIVVSLLADGGIETKISRVASAFGSSAGGIGIVIALAAVIGKCMLDSGAADRIVRFFLGLFGEKRAPTALMGSGFVLAIPVFFDTVFYLLVPLARSLHRKTGKDYLKYILAIAGGGAITHTLVPPTPGPLLMAGNLGVDFGMMILIGTMVALPSAIVGLFFASLAQKLMKTPMRPLGAAADEPEPLEDSQLPPLWLALAPVVLPVILIAAKTFTTTIADQEHRARFSVSDIQDWSALQATLRDQAADSDDSLGALVVNHPKMSDVAPRLLQSDPLNDEQKQQVVTSLNELLLDKEFYREEAFVGFQLDSTAKSLLSKNRVRMKPVDVERMNRSLFESVLPESALANHQWDTQARKIANVCSLFGDANLALLLSTVIALITLVMQRGISLTEMSNDVERALMSGGVIILITAGGGAFGAMLQTANVGPAVQELFQVGASSEPSGGIGLLLLGFLIAGVLKVAQGSSTVAMIVGSGMMAAIVSGQQLGFHPVYLATAIGSGSLMGSWMNDSGFWIFAKMGVLTEGEALKSWTVLLCILGLVGLGMTIGLSFVLPMS